MNRDIKGWRRWLVRRLLPVDGVYVVFSADGVVAIERLTDVVLTPGYDRDVSESIEGKWAGHIPYAPPSIARVRIA